MPSQEAVVAKMRGKLHNHTCTACKGFYFDACQTPGVNGTCACVTGHDRPIWLVGHDPAACCYEHSRPATVWDVEKYQLAGPGPWFQCSECKRAHGFRPNLSRSAA